MRSYDLYASCFPDHVDCVTFTYIGGSFIDNNSRSIWLGGFGIQDKVDLMFGKLIYALKSYKVDIQNLYIKGNS